MVEYAYRDDEEQNREEVDTVDKPTVFKRYVDYQLEMRGKPCASCNKPLRIGSYAVRGYDHPQGNFVAGHKNRQWIYAVCPCGYQNSYRKLIS